MFSSSPTDLGSSCRRGEWAGAYRLDVVMSATFVVLGSAVALLLAWRRTVGAIGQPLSAGPLSAVACLLFAQAVVLRSFALTIWGHSHQSSKPTSFALFHLHWWGPTVITAALTWALSIGGTALAPLGMIWSAAILQELVGAMVWRKFQSGLASSEQVAPESTNRSSSEHQATGSRDERLIDPQSQLPEVAKDPWAKDRWAEASEAQENDEELEFPQGVMQQITRFHSADGDDVLTAALRAEFDVGERQQTLHIAFCPPFATMPEFSLHQIDGPTSTLKATRVVHHGARIDIRRQGDFSTPASVLVELTACCSSPVASGMSGDERSSLTDEAS